MRREGRPRILVDDRSRYNPLASLCEDVTVKYRGADNKLSINTR